MPRNSLPLVALVALSGLSGCTVYTYDNGRAPSNYPSSRPSHGGHATKPATPHTSTQPNPQPQPAATPGLTPERRTADPKPDPFHPEGRTLPKDPPRITSPNEFGNGVGGAFRGLVYQIPQGTQKMPDFSTMTPFAMLFRDQFDTKPEDYKSGFPGVSRQSEWFGIRYEGTFTIPVDGTYHFRLVSDDGGIVYLDDQKFLDDDGVHVAINVQKDATLRAGVHRLKVDYFHTTGAVTLMLFMGKDNTELPLIGLRQGRG